VTLSELVPVADAIPGAGAVGRQSVDERERTAVMASLRPVLDPRSIAVIGASNRPRSVGHEVVRSIISGGFTGELVVVNPHHHQVLGIPSFASPELLPTAPDLAIIAVPAGAVEAVVDACGRRGVRGIVLLTAGFGEVGPAGQDLQREVLATARRYGMRMVGPNCLGVINTDPSVALNASFGPMSMEPGPLGLVSQSGALGIAVLAAAHSCGLSVAQFVSVGNKADVSANDLLLAWEMDDRVSVIALYLESFGNPRKFARIARRVSRTKPIIAIKAGRSGAGKRAGMSHTAAAASPDAVVDALFAQAGVVRVTAMQDMLDLARVLCAQPLPHGRRVAIVGNSGGPGILAADAAEAAGLIVVELDAAARDLISSVAPDAASLNNPIDLGAGVQPPEFAGAVRGLLGAADVDLVLAIYTETLVADPEQMMAAIAQATAVSTKPVVATHVGTPPRAIEVGPSGRALPVFTFPEAAVAALAHVADYAAIRSADRLVTPRPPGINLEAARALVQARLAAGADWLDATDCAELLSYYGIPVIAQRVVHSVENAARAAAEVGYPVALKIAAGVVHKSDVGGVKLGITSERALLAAFDEVTAAAPPGSGVLIQPMATSGTELIVGALEDPQFGPIVMVGAGGVLADIIADRQLRLAPVASSEAEAMISELRSAALLDGYRGRPVVSRPAVSELLVRVSLLADELRDVAELDLNPVVCSGGERILVLDAKIRLLASPATGR
jgi:acyl-CoA synthetase (NDP forming)